MLIDVLFDRESQKHRWYLWYLNGNSIVLSWLGILLIFSDSYWERCQTCKIELLAKNINARNTLAIFENVMFVRVLNTPLSFVDLFIKWLSFMSRGIVVWKYKIMLFWKSQDYIIQRCHVKKNVKNLKIIGTLPITHSSSKYSMHWLYYELL